VTRTPILILSAALVVILGDACDPVHDDAKAALGPETPGVNKGPMHRPGQPCLVCHDGAMGDPPRFTIAGTVFETQGERVAADGAIVSLVDAKGSGTQLTTNAAGNFYATPSQYDPAFPLQVTVQGPGGPTAHMETLIEGNGTVEPNGGCASCHFDPVGPNSPGHVCITLDDGGTPP
jgi:hypothetical protein